MVFQCCKRKSSYEHYSQESFDLSSRIPLTTIILENAIKKFIRESVIDASSGSITALSRYDGFFYNRQDLRNKVVEEIKRGSYQFLIMSAAYGFVHPFTKIHNYEQQMGGKITNYWINTGLPSVLKEFTETGGYRNVYGFFSKSADYRKIFQAVDWNGIPGLKEAGYFYVQGIRGVAKILKTCALLMMKLLDEGFKKKPVTFRDAHVKFVKTH